MGGMARRVGQVNVSFFAKVGNGKSSSANTLLQAWGYEGPPFEAKRQRGSVTHSLQTVEHKFRILDGAESQKEAESRNDEPGAAGLEWVSRCVSREPQKGDAVRSLDGGVAQERNEEGVKDAWELQPDEIALVIDVDKDQDFKLKNPSGDVSGWVFRKFYAYNDVVLRVTDQPGLMDANGHVVDAEHLRGTAQSGVHQDGYHVLFVVEKITDRLDATEQIILRTLKRFYGEAVCHHVVLLLTHSDVLDDEEEITRMIAESKVDVEKELGHGIAAAIAVNNHPSKADSSGRDRAKAGHDIIRAIHDVVTKFPEPFKPPEVAYEDVAWYVDEEVERNPAVQKETVLNALLRFIPMKNMKNICLIQ